MTLTALRVTEVERIRLRVPFTEATRPWNELLAGEWRTIEVCRVSTTADDVVGWGETLPSYTWQPVSDAAVARVTGANPIEHLWDDSLGAGLQMALLDAVGKALGLPAFRLLGRPQVRSEAALAWWSTKMPPDVLADEARRAASLGYRSHKFKARPWFDLFEQLRLVREATPDDYSVGLDWNALLLTAPDARAVLDRLDGDPRISVFESPVARAHLDDQLDLRRRYATPLVEHFDPAMFPIWIKHQALDGFVVDVGGLSRFLDVGGLCAAFNKPFWLQVVGAGLTTAFTLHLAAVLTHARWPAVTASNIFAHDLLRQPITPTDGLAAVPDGPGLGVEVDEDAVERYRVTEPAVPDTRRRLLTYCLPSGYSRDFVSVEHLWKDFLDDGSLPRQAPGAGLVVTDDDGSTEFAQRFAAAQRRPTSHVAAVPWPALTFYPGSET